MQFTIAYDLTTLQEALVALAAEGKSVALVPTMGALHAGHESLIRYAGTLADVVAVSIFVNPKQFGPNEDFIRYPRMLESDIKKAGEAGAMVIYAPSPEDLYPEGFTTTVSAGELSKILDGKSRPVHFDGVATVVAKLLLRVMPSVAVFGEKDYQQLCVIRRVAEDLDIPVDIIGAPTVRESDGLAMSSRNAYLSPAERKLAPVLYETLQRTAGSIAYGANVTEALAQGVAELGGMGYKVDYLELCDAETLAPQTVLATPARLLVAAWLGSTRLIDNIGIG